MRSILIAVAATAMLSAGCADLASPASEDTVRVPATDLLDLDVALPENVGGVDLGEVAPADDTSFCEAFALAPVRWVDDAVVPVQYWVDTFTHARSTAPEAAIGPIDRLLEFGQRKLDWNFKRVEDRPIWTGAEAGDARAIADVAAQECPDLQLVVGPPGRSDAPSWWSEETPEQIAASCQLAKDEVTAGIDWYLAQFGTLPLHQQQIETASDEVLYRAIDETGELPDGPYYFASDFYGVGPDGEALAVPEGACDR